VPTIPAKTISILFVGTAQARLCPPYGFAIRLFALSADATRLTGGRPIRRLISLVAASNLGMSMLVATPKPSSM
jgi:hypothetical protein